MSPITQAAGVNGSLDSFFNSLGYHTNVSNPSSYKGQAANFYNGGSLYVRSSVKKRTACSRHHTFGQCGVWWD
uniref:IncF plasmid conjugative transfer pilus assemblyprotein TraH n=1 Tax=Vibrio sp. F12 FF_152 TaxID=1652829 RepID=A0A0H4A0G2_9VIBR|nr:IncF plasmid conjugative transfer pilus assemblyprotein TraH [Vibrio sp. F12 FF_152]